MSCEDIEAIISFPEKESITLELKSFRKLTGNSKSETEKKRHDLAQEIVAMGNRFGGKIIIGLNDDGSFDGKLPYNIGEVELTADKLKESIEQVCFDSISPRIEIIIQLLECTKGDLLIIYVPKKANVPFAFVRDKKNHEITNRVYYIRTSHGKRLVSDSQLEWLFTQNEDPMVNTELRIILDLNQNYKVINGVVPWGYFQITNFIECIDINELREQFKNNENIGCFFVQLLPYMIIRSVFGLFGNNWILKITKGFDRVSYGYPKNINVSSKEIIISKIETIGNRFLDKFSWDFNEIIERFLPNKFHIPPDTSFTINYPDRKSSTISIKNPHFEFTIDIYLLSWGAGLSDSSPDYEIIMSEYQSEKFDYLIANFYNVDCACYFNTKFDFPEYDLDGFQQYYEYAKNIKELLEYYFSFELYRKNLPSKEIAILDHKLNEILNLLKNK